MRTNQLNLYRYMDPDTTNGALRVVHAFRGKAVADLTYEEVCQTLRSEGFVEEKTLSGAHLDEEGNVIGLDQTISFGHVEAGEAFLVAVANWTSPEALAVANGLPKEVY